MATLLSLAIMQVVIERGGKMENKYHDYAKQQAELSDREKELIQKEVIPEDYESLDVLREEGHYRSQGLLKLGRYEEGLEQLHQAYRNVVHRGGVWATAQRRICTLKRKLGKPPEAVDILDPEDLTEYGRENVDRVCSILDKSLKKDTKEPLTIEDVTKEKMRANVPYNTDEIVTHYVPAKREIADLLGQNWVQKAENQVRVEDGMPRIGEGWINETKLKNIVASLLEPVGCEVIHRGSPVWLGSQHLDIYIPSLDLAIEYMGRQHYEPVDYFGGEESYEENKKRDKVKKMKCTKNDVELIRYKYDEPMGPKHIAKRICEETELIIEDMDLDIDVPDDDELPSYRQ